MTDIITRRALEYPINPWLNPDYFNNLLPDPTKYVASFQSSTIDFTDSLPGQAGANLTILFEKLTNVFTLLNEKYKWQTDPAAQMAQSHIKINTTETMYEEDEEINYDTVERGLVKQVVNTTTFKDSYLPFIFDVCKDLGLEFDPGPGVEYDSPKVYAYQVFDYLKMPPVAIPQRTVDFKYSLVCRIPNFDKSLMSGSDPGLSYKVYPVLEYDRLSLVLIIHIFVGFIIANCDFATTMAFIMCLSYTYGWDKTVSKIFKDAFPGVDTSALVKSTQALKTMTEIVNHVHQCLTRQVMKNVSYDQMLTLLKFGTPEWEDVKAENQALVHSIENYEKLQQALISNKLNKIWIAYNCNEFDITQYTISGVVARVDKVQYSLSENGSVSQNQGKSQIVSTDQLYRTLTPISRQIVIKNKKIYEAHVKLDESKGTIGVDTGGTAEWESETSTCDSIESVEQHVHVSLQTANWDDAMNVAEVVPDEMYRIDKSYKFNATNISNVVKDFICSLSDTNILQVSVTYENLQNAGTCNYTYYSDSSPGFFY